MKETKGKECLPFKGCTWEERSIKLEKMTVTESRASYVPEREVDVVLW